jgi:hypothetical protein
VNLHCAARVESQAAEVELVAADVASVIDVPLKLALLVTVTSAEAVFVMPAVEVSTKLPAELVPVNSVELSS